MEDARPGIFYYCIRGRIATRAMVLCKRIRYQLNPELKVMISPLPHNGGVGPNLGVGQEFVLSKAYPTDLYDA